MEVFIRAMHINKAAKALIQLFLPLQQMNHNGLVLLINLLEF
jgi:hypothetical protein